MTIRLFRDALTVLGCLGAIFGLWTEGFGGLKGFGAN
jgi:hypothetical protein